MVIALVVLLILLVAMLIISRFTVWGALAGLIVGSISWYAQYGALFR